ncbi:lysozyme [Aurantiacibacter gilvus]|uniref:Lysozyme n=1 Tax=Aurantiacibacter gilvus TaxID=3139141 RepID=A0ABU9IAT5_9SPHN
MNRKTVFDLIRRALGRPFRQSEVDAIDAVLDKVPGGTCDNFLQDTVTPVTPSPASDWKVGEKGIALIQQFEGCARQRRDGKVEAYPDPGSSLARTGSGSGEPWTIGWGATGPGIGPGTVWTQDACDARLEADLERYAREVARALGDAPTSQPQFDALVSFHYNTGAIAKATLTRLHKAGDFAGAAREFERWCHAGGRVMKGLVRRRAAEAALYRSGA